MTISRRTAMAAIGAIPACSLAAKGGGHDIAAPSTPVDLYRAINSIFVAHTGYRTAYLVRLGDRWVSPAGIQNSESLPRLEFKLYVNGVLKPDGEEIPLSAKAQSIDASLRGLWKIAVDARESGCTEVYWRLPAVISHEGRDVSGFGVAVPHPNGVSAVHMLGTKEGDPGRTEYVPTYYWDRVFMHVAFA